MNLLNKHTLIKLSKNTGLPASLIAYRIRMGWSLAKIGARTLEEL